MGLFFDTTVGARIPNTRNPNTFEIRTFKSSVFEWFGFRMVGLFQKVRISNGVSLDRFIYKENLYLYI